MDRLICSSPLSRIPLPAAGWPGVARRVGRQPLAQGHGRLNHRHRAQSRLVRHVPQLRGADSGALYERIEERQQGGEPRERPALGDSLVVRDPAAGKVKRLRGADVSENAPLLMRLVRHPYAMEPVRYQRVEHREPAYHRARVEPLGPALAYRAELREVYRLIPPTEACAHRPEERPAPFAAVRRARREEALEQEQEVEGLPVPADALVLPGPWSGAPLRRCHE